MVMLYMTSLSLSVQDQEKNTSSGDITEENVSVASSSSPLAELGEKESHTTTLDDLVVVEEEEQSPGISVSVLLLDQGEEEEEEVLAETPEVEDSPPLREELSAPAPEPKEAAGGDSGVGVGVEEKETKEDEEQEAISIATFIGSLLDELIVSCALRAKDNKVDQGSRLPGPDIIIDITDDSDEDEDEILPEMSKEEDTDEVFPEMSVSKGGEMETGGGEGATQLLVESIIQDLIEFAVEQDPEVIIEGILDEVIGRAVSVALVKEKKPFVFACEDIRYKTKSTNSEDSADPKCGLSLFLFSLVDYRQKLRFISRLKKLRQISEKSSEPKDFMRVDYLFRSREDREKFEKKVDETRKDECFRGLTVKGIATTEKELGIKEKKPSLSENEVMWIYSETECGNLFAGASVEVVKEGQIKFKFEERNNQLNIFLACVLDQKMTFLGKVKRQAKVTLPLRMISLEKNGKVIFPVDVAGVSENELRKQERVFGFKIIKIIKKTWETQETIQVEFETSLQFYKFWTSTFSGKLNKVKFSQITLHTD